MDPAPLGSSRRALNWSLTASAYDGFRSPRRTNTVLSLRDAALRISRAHAVGSKRYETFVVRLWVEVPGNVEHGEIRHVGSNSFTRFREVAHAITFIRDVISGHETQDNLTEA